MTALFSNFSQNRQVGEILHALRPPLMKASSTTIARTMTTVCLKTKAAPDPNMNPLLTWALLLAVLGDV